MINYENVTVSKEINVRLNVQELWIYSCLIFAFTLQGCKLHSTLYEEELVVYENVFEDHKEYKISNAKLKP